ncbi:hypothetical protein DPMN_109687 [Dreissena polymorpha]|uniref:Uncharacterized protein n=1 Tax=Dreissena polymorpha TaxID=45954 RepID=A0A9D4KAQ3_DREPO|nr:hypothetical protein DPMN_109687 [Dreissena polymorpha]
MPSLKMNCNRLKCLWPNSSFHSRRCIAPKIVDFASRHVMEVLNLTIKPALCSASRIRLPSAQVVTSRNYKKQHKRVCYAILSTKGELGIVNYYLHESHTDSCVAHINRLEVVGFINPHVRHLLHVRETSVQELIPVDEIMEQVFLLDGNKNTVCVSRLPNFHGLCG